MHLNQHMCVCEGSWILQRERSPSEESRSSSFTTEISLTHCNRSIDCKMCVRNKFLIPFPSVIHRRSILSSLHRLASSNPIDSSHALDSRIPDDSTLVFTQSSPVSSTTIEGASRFSSTCDSFPLACGGSLPYSRPIVTALVIRAGEPSLSVFSSLLLSNRLPAGVIAVPPSREPPTWRNDYASIFTPFTASIFTPPP